MCYIDRIAMLTPQVKGSTRGPSVTSGRMSNHLRTEIAGSTLQHCSREPTVARYHQVRGSHVRAPLLVTHRYGTNM